MLGNTLTANDQYPVWDCENLLTPIQMHLSRKLKIFSDFLLPFLETTLNFEYLEKNDDRHTHFISENTDCQVLGYTMLLKTPFQNTL